jgi:hypothetical protein
MIEGPYMPVIRLIDPIQPMTVETATESYVSTPDGLVSTEGYWYHIPESELRTYAGEVLDRVSLEDLVCWADAWVASPRTVALWALPALLWALPNGWAVVGVAGLYVGWALLSPSMPAVAAARMMTVLQTAVAQGLYYAFILSTFAVLGFLPATVIGLGAFILFRWGVIDWIAQQGLRPLQRWFYPLPVTDQVLRGLIVRAALKYRVSVPQVDALTTDILKHWGPRADSTPASDPDSSTPRSSDDPL